MSKVVLTRVVIKGKSKMPVDVIVKADSNQEIADILTSVGNTVYSAYAVKKSMDVLSPTEEPEHTKNIKKGIWLKDDESLTNLYKDGTK